MGFLKVEMEIGLIGKKYVSFVHVWVFLTIAMLGGAGIACAQARMSKWNFKYQYQANTNFNCKYRLWEIKDSVRVYFKISFDPKYPLLNQMHKRFQWTFDYKITPSYESKSAIEEGTFTCQKYLISDIDFLFYVQIPKPKEQSAYLFIHYFTDEEGNNYLIDIPLKKLSKELYSENLFFYHHQPEVPLFEPYILIADTFMVNGLLASNKAALFYVKYNFAPALPPMAPTSTGDAEIKLSADSVLTSDYLKPLLPVGKGNIFLKSNYADKGYVYYVGENRFPELSRTRELIDACIYIASDEERKNMLRTQKPKVKLDDFWLTLAQDKDFARKMIKNYYNRVQEANKFFTHYKEGWKTDQGIIYIIFGAPDEVYKTDMKEVWKYKKKANTPALNFVFLQKNGPFGVYFFELQRSADYAQVWYNVVEQWRKGIAEK